MHLYENSAYKQSKMQMCANLYVIVCNITALENEIAQQAEQI